MHIRRLNKTYIVKNALCIAAFQLMTSFSSASALVCVPNTNESAHILLSSEKTFQQKRGLQLEKDTVRDGKKKMGRNKHANMVVSTPKTLNDTVAIILDTVVRPTDSLKELPLSKNAITDVVKYKALDSIAMEPDSKMAFIYKHGNVEYQDFTLKADDISVDFDEQVLNAKGMPDSLGKIKGKPLFVQGKTEYNANTIAYNIKSQKGIISGVITQEGEGFLHGDKVKRANDSIMYLSSGKFTTCNHAHPHFALEFSKSKLITNDKIVTGPAYLSISDVPTPLVLPFAFFPFTKGRSSGVIIPSYGWADNRGFYLRGGGYYFPINDYVDLLLAGDIYTNLSWAINPKSNYYKRYKYKGVLDLRYEKTKLGIKGTDSYSEFGDFKFAWNHQQDPKANPNSRFSANVNLVSRNYSKWTSNTNDYFNSTTNSSIAYSTTLGSYFNLSANIGESYNINTRLVELKLPSVSLSSSQFYPFRRKNPKGGYKWYENISLSYVMNAQNNVSTYDSLLLTNDVFKAMKAGISHNIPISSSVKVLKYFNWTNKVTYNERWHWNTIRKDIDPMTNKPIVDTVSGFRTNRDVTFNSALNTRLYGMFNFKKGYVKAIRHVINPSLTFNFRPDFGNPKYGFWQTYTDTMGMEYRYSIFEQSLYGGPSYGKTGNIGFSISNNLEMKVTSKKDTVTGVKKIVLIEDLRLAMSYDMAKDSLRWSSLAVTGRTTLFKSLVINYSGYFIPYALDENGNMTNQFLWEKERKFFKRQNSQWNMQLNWSVNSTTFKKDDVGKNTAGTVPTNEMIMSPFNNPNQMLGNVVDFSVPWNFSLAYTLSFVSQYYANIMNYESDVVQTLSLRGDLNLTKNWKIAFTTGYDFESKKMSYTSLDIYRDLHCWERRFNWVPFGYYKSWNFTINVKAGMLQDLKYNMRNSYQDNQNYIIQ